MEESQAPIEESQKPMEEPIEESQAPIEEYDPQPPPLEEPNGKRKLEDDKPEEEENLYGDPIKPDPPARARRSFDIDPDVITADYEARVKEAIAELKVQEPEMKATIRAFLETSGAKFEEEERVAMSYKLFDPRETITSYCDGILLGEFCNKANVNTHLIFSPISRTFSLIADIPNPVLNHELGQGAFRWILAADSKLETALALSKLQHADQPPSSKKTKLDLKCDELREAIRSGDEFIGILQDTLQEVCNQAGSKTGGSSPLKLKALIQEQSQ
jgi:hypothetical protein